MTPTSFEISAALAMIAVAAVLILWFRYIEADHSTLRMMRMMRRFSLDPRLITNGNPHIQATLSETRRRCGRCRVEGFCGSSSRITRSISR